METNSKIYNTLTDLIKALTEMDRKLYSGETAPSFFVADLFRLMGNMTYELSNEIQEYGLHKMFKDCFERISLEVEAIMKGGEPVQQFSSVCVCLDAIRHKVQCVRKDVAIDRMRKEQENNEPNSNTNSGQGTS